MRFLIVGGLSTVINYSIFLLLYWFGLNYLSASAVGFLSGVFFGYILNKNWTYSVVGETAPGLAVRYVFVYLLSLFSGLGFIYVVVDLGGVSPLLGNVASILVTTFLNFIGTRFFVFR